MRSFSSAYWGARGTMGEMQPAARHAANPALANLPVTRRAILLALKKRGEARAEELADIVGVTVSAIRQHLAGLTASALVDHREAKSGPGRPKHVYFLTPTAEALFPKTYSDLTNELLDYVEEADPELLAAIFERRRMRRLSAARRRLEGKPFAEQVAELARILDEDGYLADFEAQPDGTYRVIEHNCAILGVATRHTRACSSEIAFLREALPAADVRRVAHMISGAHRCEYVIAPRPVPV
jgi:DeoR family suf operon transcriptional repressor